MKLLTCVLIGLIGLFSSTVFAFPTQTTNDGDFNETEVGKLIHCYLK